MGTKKLIILIAFFTLCSLPVFALEVTYPSLPGAPNLNSTGAGLPEYILYLFYFVNYATGFILVVSLIVSGVKYFSAGGNVANILEARGQFSGAVTGFFILVTANLVLGTINPDLISLRAPDIKELSSKDLILYTSPKPEAGQSSIYTEIPIGRLVEKTLELELPATPSPEPSATPTPTPQNQETEPKMTRIWNVSNNILSLSKKIKENTNKIKTLSGQCQCGDVDLLPGNEKLCVSPNPDPEKPPATEPVKLPQSQIIPYAPPNSKDCPLKDDRIESILDSSGLYWANYNSAPKSKKPLCWLKTDAYYTAGDNALQAGPNENYDDNDENPSGIAILKTIIPQKGYLSFDYKNSFKEPYCSFGSNPAWLRQVYEEIAVVNIEGDIVSLGKPPINPITGKEEWPEQYIRNQRTVLTFKHDWTKKTVLLNAGTVVYFEAKSALDSCYAFLLDNVKFTPYIEETTPSPTPEPTEGCSCDPCKSVRSKIQQYQEENMKLIYKGALITQIAQDGTKKDIVTSLVIEQEKAAKEMRLIKEDVGKLERMEEFMLQCGASNLIDLGAFLRSREAYPDKWNYETANFWNEIKIKDDMLSFYCPVSGTIWKNMDVHELFTYSSALGFSERILIENLKKETPRQQSPATLIYVKEEIKSQVNVLKSEKTTLKNNIAKEANSGPVLALLDDYEEIITSKAELEAEESNESNIKEINSLTLRAQSIENSIKKMDISKNLSDLALQYADITATIIELEAQIKILTEEKIREIGGGYSAENAYTGAGEEYTPPAVACTKEVAIGELIDRTKRTGYKITERLEKLSRLSEELVSSTSDFHRLISQCSAKRCAPKCVSQTPDPSPQATPDPNSNICGYPWGQSTICPDNTTCLIGPSCENPSKTHFFNNPFNQISCNQGSFQFFDSKKATCCESRNVCGLKGEKQICCPNPYDYCVLGENGPSCIPQNTSGQVNGVPGKQLFCPAGQNYALTKDGPRCGTGNVCGALGYQKFCSGEKPYCVGIGQAPECDSSSGATAWIDYFNNQSTNMRQNMGAVSQYCGEYSAGQNIFDISYVSCLGKNGLPLALRWKGGGDPFSNSNFCYYCCEKPAKSCGSGWTIDGKNYISMCCAENETCINNSSCCAGNICRRATGSPNYGTDQTCCKSNQKCGTYDGGSEHDYCVDYCPEPPEQICTDFEEVLNPKNVKLYELNRSPFDFTGVNPPEYQGPDGKYHSGFYVQTGESYIGGSAIAWSPKIDKLYSKTADNNKDNSNIGNTIDVFSGTFTLPIPGKFSFYYKTTSYYWPGSVTVECEAVDNSTGEKSACSPIRVALEPSTTWNKIEFYIPEGDEARFQFSVKTATFYPGLKLNRYLTTDQGYKAGERDGNDDCMGFFLDKLEYVPLGEIKSECEGDPCPSEEINKKYNEIVKIVDGQGNDSASNTQIKEKEGIADVVSASLKNTNNKSVLEQIGINTIIKEVVPDVFKDLRSARENIKGCVVAQNENNNMSACELTLGQIGPDGKIIKNCCYKECYYSDCLEQCYLKVGRINYRTCLTECLKGEQEKEDRASALNSLGRIQNINECRHLLNFYCCNLH